MTDVVTDLREFVAFLQQGPTHLSKALEAVVIKNVEEYLDTLDNISPDEEIRILNRRGRVSDQSANVKYRERLIAFKTVNQDLKHRIGDEAVNQHVLQNPLRVALIDDSILQLFKMAAEISSLITAQKIDGPSLTYVAEKAVTQAITDEHLSEVRRQFSELTDIVIQKAANAYFTRAKPQIEAYVAKTVADSVGRST